ncbi:hypothetical protein DN390_22220 [Bacillus sp. SH7-1]|uniref:hypothetical protein n=1 Tax=Bacillus sp. SH7-1 TaxID=2217818 RepID=UPI0011CAA0F3|nr:hypothetical protein [Bacillus sp. SH7-1]TXR95398.1 hypothetical protein DN390_22220 [Bacillus sp. SH7-1]
MSETPKGKIFGVNMSAEEITLGTDGSVIINNPALAELVKAAQLHTVTELMSARDVNVGCPTGNVYKCSGTLE